MPSLSNGHRIDGSGRGVHMDAPIVKNWKNASGYTRWSYIWTFGSLAIMVLSYKYMLYHYGMYNIQYQCSLYKIDVYGRKIYSNIQYFYVSFLLLIIKINTATTFLQCENDSCTLKIIPPSRAKSLTLKFHKEQIVTVQHISVTSQGEYNINQEYDDNRRHYRNHHGSHHSKSIPNKDELFDSFGLVLAQDGKDMVDLQKLEEDMMNDKGGDSDGDNDASEEQEKEGGENGDEAEDEKLWNEMLEEGVISKEQRQLMEQYGSAAATDPDLMAKFEQQKEALLKQRRKQASAERSRDSVNKAKERMSIMKQKHEEKRQKIEERRQRYGNYPRLDELYEWAEVLGEGHFMVVMRKYNIGHRKRRVTSLMRSMMNYIEGKRERIVVRENRNIVWQGILGIVLGMFSFLLSLLVGQFWEPVEKKSYRTPGSHANTVRRKHVDHLTAQGPPRVPTHFPSAANRTRQGVARPKAYGGYMPGKSTY